MLGIAMLFSIRFGEVHHFFSCLTMFRRIRISLGSCVEITHFFGFAQLSQSVGIRYSISKPEVTLKKLPSNRIADSGDIGRSPGVGCE